MASPLSVNVFTAPEKELVAERSRPFGPPPAWDPMTSTLVFGEHDAVLVDALTTAAEAEALAAWVGLHHRNLTTIYVTHGHLDHFAGLGVLLRHFPDARAIATAKTVAYAREQVGRLPFYRRLWPGQLPAAVVVPEPWNEETTGPPRRPEPEDGGRRPQEAGRPGHSRHHHGDQELPHRLRPAPAGNRQRPGAIRRHDRAVSRLGQPSGVADVRLLEI